MSAHLVSLRSLLDLLGREGELRVVDAPVDPALELAEIQRRVVAAQGPALLFTCVKGTRFPVATNLYGTPRRVELAFGREPVRFFRQVAEAAEVMHDLRARSLWRCRGVARRLLRLGWRTRRSAPVLECSPPSPRLSLLPQVKSWPLDGGAFLTLPLAYSEHPATGRANIGMYRNQIFPDPAPGDAAQLGMHVQIHRGLGFHHHEAELRGEPLPVNIFLGGPPALTLAAVAPLPEDVPEAVFASLVMGGRIGVVRPDGGMPVVAEAEFALCGEMPPDVRREEGPFGDHYGYYSLRHPFPVFSLRRMFHRKDAIFPATVVGRPRQEDHYIGDYLQELFAPLYPLVMNGVRAVRAYDDAGMHPLAAAVVSERYPREAFMAGLRILGEGQLSLTKFLLLTDAPLPLREFRPLLTHILERADFATDLFIFSPVAEDTLDYTGGRLNEGGKAILMGLGGRRFELAREAGGGFRDGRFGNPRVYAPGVVVVEGPAWGGDPAALCSRLAAEGAVRPFRLAVMVDRGLAADCAGGDEAFLWTVFTRFDPAADIHSREVSLKRLHPGFEAPLVLDCRMKPWYPPLALPAPETVAAVDARWKEFFPASL
ncbi:MAG: UbiD family decarboxylase [Acidobacteriota bacterium]|jgi:UbiD family decarboxylase|nr:UbiD family decarboxylase [Acidobacteriota bacterium]